MTTGNYDLVMPFVSVRSKGGPYDDDAYAAGWAMGALDARLSATAPGDEVVEDVRAADLRQAELVAMRHGCSLTSSPVDEDWTQVRCARNPRPWDFDDQRP